MDGLHCWPVQVFSITMMIIHAICTITAFYVSSHLYSNVSGSYKCKIICEIHVCNHHRHQRGDITDGLIHWRYICITLHRLAKYDDIWQSNDWHAGNQKWQVLPRRRRCSNWDVIAWPGCWCWSVACYGL